MHLYQETACVLPLIFGIDRFSIFRFLRAAGLFRPPFEPTGLKYRRYDINCLLRGFILLIKALGDLHDELPRAHCSAFLKKFGHPTFTSGASLAALTRNARPSETSKCGALGLARVVAVQVGWGEILDQMHLEFHS
jgi:hypothetical protein